MSAAIDHLRIIGAAIFLLAVPTGNAMAQGGSVGGAIPKQNKTVSGGGGKVSEPQKTERKPTRKRNGSAKATLDGHWRVAQKCNRGNFVVELNIAHTSPTEFAGTSKGVTTGQSSSIVDGRLENGHIEFSRVAGIFSDRWTATMKGAGRFAGTSAGPGYTCSYTAVRR